MNTFCRSFLGLLLTVVAVAQDRADTRAKADRLRRDNNPKEAVVLFEKLVLDPENSGGDLVQDYGFAVQCHFALGQQDAAVDLAERVVDVHPDAWQLLRAVADDYLGTFEHVGYVVAGEFHRGYQRGGNAEYVACWERDRTRALQLLQQAVPHVLELATPSDQGKFFIAYAQTWNRGANGPNAWRLQAKTDLATLPDYEPIAGPWAWRPSHPAGAPVDAAGNPIFYAVPASIEAAANDGERMRWCYHAAVRQHPESQATADAGYADFLRDQFGVQTLRGFYQPRSEDVLDEQQGVMSLNTLADDETVARLAGGVKRFKLPAEHNFIALYRRSDRFDQLGIIYENRLQYDKAADCWRRLAKQANHWQERLNQIVQPLARFEQTTPQPAGRPVSVDFVFRNATAVHFRAREIDIDQVVRDYWEYLKGNPKELSWQYLQIGNIGNRVVVDGERKYLGKTVAEWDRPLAPRDRHYDKRIQVTTPLDTQGVYLLEGEVKDGNTTRIVTWVTGMALVRKELPGAALFFAADAMTGAPVAGAKLQFYGYEQEYIRDQDVRKKTGRRFNLHTREFSIDTDANGIARVADPQFGADSRRYRWLVLATAPDGRRAISDPMGIATRGWEDSQPDRERVFIITDRPVYRPGQTVKYHFWAARADYADDNTLLAKRSWHVGIRDAQNTQFHEADLTTDEFGGAGGEFVLPADIRLGVCRLNVGNDVLTFRVEEYKKPEFEVTVEAPEEPVMLGDPVPVTVKATYYFGAPVAEATVKVKILRHDHDALWFPWGPWDWLYGSGYWWFAGDYSWYSGWERWGCLPPHPIWWHGGGQPEVVLENELPSGPDGTVTLTVDTAVAKELMGDRDHRYEITAEVTDASRRTIVGKGSVVVARDPFRVYLWVDRGHYKAGDAVNATVQARTADGRPVAATGRLRLLRVTWTDANEPRETEIESWPVETAADGRATQRLVAAEPGQYRLSCTLRDAAGREIEGGYLLLVAGPGFDGRGFRYSDLELLPDKPQYRPGDRAELMLNTNHLGATVLFFPRALNGLVQPPEVLTLAGKSTVVNIDITAADMPNVFVEALTVFNGEVHSVVRQLVVPPVRRVLDMELTSPAVEYRPGAEATVDVKLIDETGEPVAGQVVMTTYDKSLEYISGGPNVRGIREFFWDWQRHHRPQMWTNLMRGFGPIWKRGDPQPRPIGAFGDLVGEMTDRVVEKQVRRAPTRARQFGAEMEVSADMAMVAEAAPAPMAAMAAGGGAANGAGGGEPELVEPTVREAFADTAYWGAPVSLGVDGRASVPFAMPDNLTTWKTLAWAIAPGTRVGESTLELITTKNLILRLQAPRFVVETDEVVLSANVHNYLATAKTARVVIELEGGVELLPEQQATREVDIPADGEARVDWRVRVRESGPVTVRMKALTDEESDAMQLTFPAKVHGAPRMVAASANLPEGAAEHVFTFTVPEKRRPESARLVVRYSPTLAGAMVDALPYLVAYPYGCTEQTLNRFVPTVLVQKILLDTGVDLAAVREKQANLNAQELGDPADRAADWRRNRRWHEDPNPVYDVAKVREMVGEGVGKLEDMQLGDGGWGWFSGYGEWSSPHTTAVVVHGLLLARANDAQVPAAVLDRGVEWLVRYEQAELAKLRNWTPDKEPRKQYPDNVDAFAFSVLTEAGTDTPEHGEMGKRLYDDRARLSVYSTALLALAAHSRGQTTERDMLRRNIEQYLKTDAENQTAWLELPNSGYWWFWYGSEFEAHAAYLRLLAAVDPRGQTAPWLVKYLLNNRKHAGYWQSTRDTAYCLEAMAAYLRATDEMAPDQTVQILVDGKVSQEVVITPKDLFQYRDRYEIGGPALTAGEHTVTVRRQGKGALYMNAYLEYFSLEDFIPAAGLEIKVQRRYYRLEPEEATALAPGARGQALGQRVEKYKRIPLEAGAEVASGDLIEVELEIASKNDYEYVVFADYKPAGVEPVDVRSGYGGQGLRAYREFRDDRVCLFVQHLARGEHSVSYRVRAEIPGKFSALPALASAMYAPELRGNSDEMKLSIRDR